MKAFFDSIDAKVATFFKSKFRKKVKTVAAPIAQEDVGAPTFFMMGSLTDCSLKDATAYVSGLAETYITAPDLAHIRIFDDQAGNRYIYELHEGGPGRSVVERVLEELKASAKVRVRLVNGAQTVIEEAHGELFALVYPATDEIIRPETLPGFEPDVDEGRLWRIEELAGDVELAELYPQKRALVHIGGVILGFALSAFILTGGIYTVMRSGVFDGDDLLRQLKAGYVAESVDNPVWQLDKARSAADLEGKSLRALKKGPNGWSWELSK